MCLGEVSLAMINTMTKSNGEEIVLFVLYLKPSTKKSRGRDLEAGTEAKAIEGLLLTGFLLKAYSVCFLRPAGQLGNSE